MPTAATLPDGIAPLFQPLELGKLTLPNRLAVAPMTRVSATADGLATPAIAEYYAAFAQGGFGLLITEGLYTDTAHAQGYLHQPGMATAAQQASWREVIKGVHAQGGRIVAQLMHAGALSQGNPWRSGTLAPSAVQPAGEQMRVYRGQGPYALPRAMSQADIDAAVRGFAHAAVLAREAGFDGVEIHGANGYLLDQFLTAHTNLRDDAYGGELIARLRLITETVHAVRGAVGAAYPVGLRLSQGKVNDFTHTWPEGEAGAALLFQAAGKLPLDFLHTTAFEAWQPAFGHGPSLAALAKRHAGTLPVLANGSLHDPAAAAGMLARREADAVTLGRGALTHPDWPARVRAGMPLEDFDPGLLSPIADLDNARRHRAAV
jgi:2,4-dienoyl-CoA reductase-like NADH-dependent reductase (Old Yellow Enzyme family)